MINQNPIETRGRKRSPAIEKKIARLEARYQCGKMPASFSVSASKDLKTEIHRLRCSTSFKELQKRLGVKFSIFPVKGGFVVRERGAK